MSFPRYEHYKESGVEWLGEVPEGWEVKRLKSLLIEPLMYGANEAADEDDPANPRFVRITDIDDNSNLREKTFKSLPTDIAKPFLLNEGDVLLARSGATVGKSFIYKDSWGICCFAGYLIRARLNTGLMDTDFFFACCQSTFYWQYVSGTQIQSTIQNVSAEKYANLWLPCPSLSEQHTIAAFLDRETGKIDELVAEQERLIALLKEKRQATISHAVTKGLNPDAPMKDSRIEWLGAVPVGWEVCALKRIASLKSGESITADNIEEVGEYSVFGGNGLRGFTDAYTHEGHYALVGRQGALCGNVNYATGKFWASEHAVVVSPKKLTSTIWIGELLREMNLNQYSVSAAQPGLSVEIISNLLIAVPPLEEQFVIATFLDSETTKIDALVGEARQAIGLLKERRSALISAAVTGKIDVRENNEFRGAGKCGSCERLLAEREADMRHEA